MAAEEVALEMSPGVGHSHFDIVAGKAGIVMMVGRAEGDVSSVGN